MHGLALFAGGGGLELGLSLAIGTHYKTVAYVERECTSAAVLATNMERKWLHPAPIWDDVTTFTGDVVSPLVDNIDIVTAGFPCQPWSAAGNRKGIEDDRWLWPIIFRLVREIRPRSIFLENVPGLLHGGIEHVLGDLASVGFDAEWASVRASDVGAPHRRERVFILADSRHKRPKPKTGKSSNRYEFRSENGNRAPFDFAGPGGGELGNTTSERLQEKGQYIERPSQRATSDRTTLGDTNDSGNSALRHGVNGNGAQDEQRWNEQPQHEFGGFGKNMGYTGIERLERSHDHRKLPRGLQPCTSERCGDVDDSCGNECERQIQEHADGFISFIEPGGSMVNARSERRWVESFSNEQPAWIDWGRRPFHWPPTPNSANWQQILKTRPDLAPSKSPVRGVVNGLAGGLARSDQLRILGNGVVPQQAALAYTLLRKRLNH